MNGEEKEFNVENNVGVDSLNNMPQNNMDSISIDSLENSANFGMDMGIQANTMQSSSMTQMPNEEFNMTMNNADSMSTYQPDTSMPFVNNVTTSVDTASVTEISNQQIQPSSMAQMPNEEFNMTMNNVDSMSTYQSDTSMPFVDNVATSVDTASVAGIPNEQVQPSSMAQMPNEEFNMTMNNVDSMSTYQLDTSMPFVDNVVTPLDTSVVPDTQNAFVYTEDVSKDTQQSSSFTPQSQTSYTNNRTVNKQDDLKSNFKFMIIFAVIMLAIVILLPYIA